MGETQPGFAFRTCEEADQAKFETHIREVFPLRKSISMVRYPGCCEKDVFMAEIPAYLFNNAYLSRDRHYFSGGKIPRTL